ncbi:hypothetical protein TNCV_1938901 [Trichonephila clavipes]|nr:hypothetical protein TNCV_1938901 [Trichonephila clavipes]
MKTVPDGTVVIDIALFCRKSHVQISGEARVFVNVWHGGAVTIRCTPSPAEWLVGVQETESRENVKDVERSERLQTSRTTENIEKCSSALSPLDLKRTRLEFLKLKYLFHASITQLQGVGFLKTRSKEASTQQKKQAYYVSSLQVS